jgi:hypothetical protein
MRVLRFVVGRAILLHRPIEIVVALVFESGLAVASIDQAGFVGLSACSLVGKVRLIFSSSLKTA